jgi:proline dehydrogenase
MGNVVDRAVVRVLPAVPKPIVRKVSSRYIAGDSLDDAVTVVGRLNEAGKMATLDVLGEHLDNAEQTRDVVREYRAALDAIESNRLDSNVSIKLTALGLPIDRDLCLENAETVIRHARERSNFVRIDMEESDYTERTLDIYRELRGRGYDNVGVVLQSRLRRTLRDIRSLADLTPNVRLCKGIYLEPELIAYQGYQEVRHNFVAALDELLQGGSYVGIATHDEWLLERGLERVAGMDAHDYEFQMLLGVRTLRGDRLVRDGHRLRIYTPYGKQWREYSLRRLQENPKIAGYILSDLFGVNGR